MANQHHVSNPPWSWAIPVFGAGLLVVKLVGVVQPDAVALVALAAVLLFGTVFAAVHHAELLAVKLGEPFGSILLAVAVTIIEVALIVSIMLSDVEGGDVVARDTVFAALMIVLNGIVGLCLVLGGRRHFEQTFQLKGASSALAVLGTLAVLTLILPNYTLVAGPSYSNTQLIVIGAASFCLWTAFIFVQTVKHRDYFLDLPLADDPSSDVAEIEFEKPTDGVAMVSLALLLVSLIAVVLLAKLLSPTLEQAVAAAGLPYAFVGVVVAAVVLLPEGIAAAKSALKNQLQNSINLALGSAIACIGLTIPAVAVVSLLLGHHLALGISTGNMTLLALTLFVGTLTLGTGRTTVLQGHIHLVIFVVFLLMSAAP
ncbi:ionic transporter y4hA [Rhizobium calliandrae]|uniref:Ionic transporter y4hA n=1 Tax=Rhizobium calliandrae TaxID=1312182 RepID=A0ABT7KGS0_9HYPH|nr:ionic transporter y4hA [Rhizobium calliandrae]MDL2407372.1 ionic transporter y4hA [Rhizobium calliandrae]